MIKIKTLKARAIAAVNNEIARSKASGDLYDPQRALWELNDGKHPDETYEQALEAITEAEEQAEAEGGIEL